MKRTTELKSNTLNFDNAIYQTIALFQKNPPGVGNIFIK